MSKPIEFDQYDPHIMLLLDKVADATTIVGYAQQTIVHGWSRNVLAHQIKTRLHERHGKAISNFDRTLPAPQSDLAREALKSTYNFEFLGLDDQPTIGLVLCADHNETVVEYALQDVAAPVAVADYAHVLPSVAELRTAIDEGRRAYLESTR